MEILSLKLNIEKLGMFLHILEYLSVDIRIN